MASQQTPDFRERYPEFKDATDDQLNRAGQLLEIKYDLTLSWEDAAVVVWALGTFDRSGIVRSVYEKLYRQVMDQANSPRVEEAYVAALRRVLEEDGVRRDGDSRGD